MPVTCQVWVFSAAANFTCSPSRQISGNAAFSLGLICLVLDLKLAIGAPVAMQDERKQETTQNVWAGAVCCFHTHCLAHWARCLMLNVPIIYFYLCIHFLHSSNNIIVIDGITSCISINPNIVQNLNIAKLKYRWKVLVLSWGAFSDALIYRYIELAYWGSRTRFHLAICCRDGSPITVLSVVSV